MRRLVQIRTCGTFAGAIGFLLVLSPTAARADGFAIDHFDPSERGSEWFALDSLDFRGHLRPAVGVVGDWGFRPLVERDGRDSLTHSIVRNQVVIHPGASLVAWDRVRFGMDLPVQAYADGKGGTVNGQSYAPPSAATALGDLRLSIDARLAGAYRTPIEVALGVEAFLPTGDTGSYAGDGNVRVAPHGIVAGDLGPVAYSAKIGATIRGLDATFAGSHLGSDIFVGGSVGVRFASDRLLIGPEVFGTSVVGGGAFLTRAGTALEGLLGAHYTFSDAWRVGAGVSAGLTDGFGAPQRRGVLSFEWTPGVAPSDRDGDGIADAVDACPNVPGARSEDPGTNGCPAVAPRPADRDGDGVPDAADACVDVPGIKTSDRATNGCPPDRDRDGVTDAVDACPDVPGARTEDPKTNGCPGDRDHDGVLDTVDACPDVAGMATSDPKTNGCPDADRDRDGVPNGSDACPDLAGKPDPDPKKNGCPEAFVSQGQIEILDQIKFETGSAKIANKESEAVLVAVRDVLTGHPEIAMVRVEGHTDDRGGAAMNKRLSAARAASVVEWLVSKGISASRLSSQGFGTERPMAPNDTEAGRKENRRVEFHLVGP